MVWQPNSSGAMSANCLGELPAMAGQVLHGAVPLAVLAVRGGLDDASAVSASSLELRLRGGRPGRG